MIAGTAQTQLPDTPPQGLGGSGFATLPLPIRLFALLVAATAATWPTLAGLEAYWSEVRDYHHGYVVVLLVAAWLVASRRRLARLESAPSPAVLLPLALALLAWMIAVRGESLMLSQLLWPVILALTVWAGCGMPVARAVLPALGYLYFATPLWDHLVPLLQWLTVMVSERMLSVVGIPFDLDGNFVTLRDGTFEIAEGCAGKRYFVVTLAVAMALGVVERFPPWRLLVFMLLAAALAMVMNWIRVVVIIVVGHVTAMQHYLVAVEHESFGWVLFGVLLGAVLWLGHVQRPQEESLGPSVDGPSGAAAVAGSWWPLPLLASVWAWQTLAPDPAPLVPKLGDLPVLTGVWQGPYPPVDAWRPAYVGFASEVRAAYDATGRRVEVYANVYGTQSAGRELVGYSNSVTGTGWRVLESLPQLASGSFLAGDSPVYVIAGPTRDDAWVVGRVLMVGGSTTSSELIAQALYGAHALARPVPAGALAIAARCEGDCKAARADLEAFWAAAGAELLDMIPASSATDCSRLSASQRVGEEC